MGQLAVLSFVVAIITGCWATTPAAPAPDPAGDLAGFWFAFEQGHKIVWHIRPDGTGQSCASDGVQGKYPMVVGLTHTGGRILVEGFYSLPPSAYDITSRSGDEFVAQLELVGMTVSYRMVRQAAVPDFCKDYLS